MILRRKTKGAIEPNEQILERRGEVEQIGEHLHDRGEENKGELQDLLKTTPNNKDMEQVGDIQGITMNESCSSFLGDKIDLDSVALACQEHSVEENNLKFVAYEIIDTQRQQQERLEGLQEQLKQAQSQLKEREMQLKQEQASLGDTISFLKQQLEKATEQAAQFQEKAERACQRVQQLERELSIKDGKIACLQEELLDSQQIHSRCSQTKPDSKILSASRQQQQYRLHHQKENIIRTNSNLLKDAKNENHKCCCSSSISGSQVNLLSESLTFEILRDSQKQLNTPKKQTNKNSNNSHQHNFSHVKNQNVCCNCSTTFQTSSCSSSRSNANIEQHFQNLDTIPLDMLLQQIRTTTTNQAKNQFRKNSIGNKTIIIPPSSCTSSPSNKSTSFDTMNCSAINHSNTPNRHGSNYRNMTPNIILSSTARQQKQARVLNVNRPASSKSHKFSSSPSSFRATNPYFDSRWVGLVHPLTNNNSNSKKQFIPPDAMLFTKSPLQRKNKTRMMISQARATTIAGFNSTTTQQQQSPSISMRNTAKNRLDFRKAAAKNYDLEIR